MKVNPQQAPLYGKCVLTVVLSDAEVAQVRQVCQEDGEGAELYLLFSGSTQRHLCSTRRTHDHGTLQAICPAHDCCEIVQVTLCVARSPVGGASTNNDQPEPEPEATPTSTPVHTPVPVQHLGQVCFGFVQDLAFDMAQYLVSCVGRADAEGLEGVLMLDDYTIPQQECERLDHNLALALKHLHLPTGWSLLGTHLGTETDPEPHETLLHFACRRGLVRVASFLLRQRGALEALRLPNTQGLTPHTLAQRHPSVMELLDREEGVALEREYDDDATVFRCRLSCGGFGVLEHHSSLGTYTLTVELRPLTHTHSRTPSDTQAPTQDTQSFGTGLQQDTQELWSLVQKHTHHSQKAGEALTTPLGQPDSNSNEGSPAHQHSHRENTHACEITSGDTHTREKISGPPHPSRDPDSPRVVGRSATPPQPPPPSPPPLPLHPLHLPVPLPPLPLLLSLLVGEARPSQPAISSPSNQQDGGKQQQQQQQPPERSAEEHEEEECVCGNPGSDSSVTPSQQHTTTATETRAVGEEQGARVGIDSGLDNTHTTQEHTAGATADTTAEGEEEHTGEEGSSGVQGDTQLVNTLTDSHTHREPGGASGEEAVSPRRSGGEQEEESTSSSTAQDLISSAQGAAEREVSQQEEGEQKEEEEEGKREEEKEEEEEVEPLPDQKHPSGLGGVADAAEVRGTAEQSPDTHEHSPVTEEQSPATAAAEQRTDTAETEQAAPAAEICTESAARTTEQKTESDGTATATQIEPTAIEIESTRTEPESTEIESARTAAESTRTELECTASEVSSAGTEGESTGSCTRTVKAVTTVTEADMGLTQSQTDQEVSDLDSRHTEAEGGEEKEEREEEEEEEEDRDESEEYLDASSTSMEGEYLLFEECDDSVVDSPSNTGPGANVSDPTQREEVASTEKSESSFQDCIEGETSTDCVVPAQTEEGSVELETQATSDFSATATASPCLQEASGHQGTDDGLSNITSGNDYDITARVSCDSGSEDLPDLTTIIADQQEVTSLGGVMPAGDACHTHLRDITEHEFSEDTHTQEDLTSIPECRAAGAAAVAECDMDTSEGNVPSSQDKVGEEMECQPSCHIAPDEVVLEVEEEGEVQGEIPSDVCPSQSEEALHASSNDTQEEVEKEVNEETQKEVKEVEDGVREEKDICPSHSDESQPACCDDSPSVLEGEVRRHREEKETQQEVYSEESRPASSDDTLEVEAQGHQEVYSDACPSHSEDSRPASSDACPSHSEDSRPASSDDTLEALDDDSSTMSESEQPTKTTRLQRIKQLQLDTTDGSDTQVCEEEEESSPQETSSPDLAHTPEHTPAAPSDESSEGKAGRRDAAHESTCPETVTDAQTGDFERGQSATGGSSDTHSHTLTHIQSHNDGYSDTLTYTHAHDDRCQGSESAQQHTTSTPTISNTTATTTTTSSPPSEGGAAETGHSPEKEFEEEARGVRTTPSHHHQHQASKQGRSEVTEELRREETAPPITSAPRTKQRALLDAAVSMETKQEVAEEVRVAGQRSGGADGEMFPAGGHVHGRKSAMRRVAGRHLTPALSLDSHTTPIHTDKECFGAAPHTLSHTHSHTHSQTHTHTHRSLERGPSIDSADSPQSSRSSISTLQRDSGSDTDGFCSTDTGEDNVFRKDECVTCGGGDSTSEVSVSCSSTDDAASLGHRSSSSTSSSRSSSSRLLSARLRQTHSHTHSHAHSHTRHGAVVVTTGSATGSGGGGGAAGLVSVDTEEEAKDCVSEVPLRSSLLRNSIRSLSPFRRHSWGPGKNAAGEGDMNQRSLSWCPSDESMSPCVDQCSDFSFSLEGLVGSDGVDGKSWQPHGAGGTSQGGRRAVGRQESDDRGSLVSLTEEEHEHESDMADSSSLDSQKSRRYQPQRRSAPSMTLPLTKSVSMLAISQRDIDAIGRIRQKRRLSFGFNFSTMRSKMSRQQTVSSSSSDERGEEDEYDEEEIDDVSMNSYSSNMGSVDCSITEEGLGPLRDFDGKGSTKVSRTFSYLKSKMSKRSRDKDSRHKEKEAREREKQRASSGHVFGLAASHQTTMCPQCHKAVSAKDAFVCNNCYVCVHKGCRDSLPVCAKKQHYAVPDSSTLPTVTLRPKSSSSRERPWSAILSPEEHSLATAPRRHTLMPFNSSNLSKSISISNIAGHQMFDDMPSLKGLRYLSQSTDSLNKPSRVHESTESLVDEGTEMIDSQLLGEFEADARELENDSWSFSVDKKTLKHLKKDTIKRQDVIYELIQTELHHVRTLRVMGEVYCKGLQKEVGLECAVLDRMFPALDDLLDLHTHFLSSMLERKREAQILAAQQHSQAFVIERIGDVLIEQFSGPTAECMKRVYGKFCSRHNEAVNLYKEHHAKDKRFQAFIKRKMSSSIVRRMGIPECILLVTQRITKYPVLLQRILHHTRDDDEEYEEVSQALSLVKEAVAAVDVRVNEQEKRKRLKEIHSRTDSKSIMRMKSGQMFAREDLLRRRLVHDGALQLKTNTGRLKDVQAVLLSDILVFLQEKDQKYVFASLDQRSTVLSLQKLIAREVANEERALFLITAGTERPEMVEVHASTKEDRNAWMQLLQQTMQSIEKDEDEGIPSENEEDKRLMESKAKELREVLQRKDEQIVLLLQEKMKLFRDMCDCPPPASPDDPSGSSALVYKMLFRACSEDVPKGEPIMINALKEVEMLQTLVNGSLGGAVGQQVSQDGVGGVGPVVLPRRAETFGGFDSHQLNTMSKSGDKEDGEEAADLRRTESDSVLKKGGNANLLLLLKRNSEVLHSVTNLHDLLASLQAVVVQQDTFIEDQRQALSERPSSVSSSSSITSSTSSSRASSRPNSLIEQERQRSLEKQRQEATALQRQRDAHAEERKRRERHWETRERDLAEKEAQTAAREEELRRKRRELEQAKQELQQRKEDYQRDLERLRDGQRRLEREREALEQAREEKHIQRTPSSTSEDSLYLHSASVFLEPDPHTADNDASRKHSLGRLEPPTTTKAKGLNQMPSRFLQLTKGHKDKKEKKKKKNKHPLAPESSLLPLTEPVTDGEIYFC